jgi:hypothetical protein
MKKKVVLLSLVMVLALVGSALAKEIKFAITKQDGSVYITDNRKDLPGSYWEISNVDAGYSDFVENFDVIGFRVRDVNDNYMSDYEEITEFCYRKQLPYTTLPTQGSALRLRAQIADRSFYNSLKFEGEWRT